MPHLTYAGGSLDIFETHKFCGFFLILSIPNMSNTLSPSFDCGSLKDLPDINVPRFQSCYTIYDIWIGKLTYMNWFWNNIQKDTMCWFPFSISQQTHISGSATWTFVVISSPTWCSRVAPPCSRASVSAWPRNSARWHHPRWGSRWGSERLMILLSSYESYVICQYVILCQCRVWLWSYGSVMIPDLMSIIWVKKWCKIKFNHQLLNCYTAWLEVVFPSLLALHLPLADWRMLNHANTWSNGVHSLLLLDGLPENIAGSPLTVHHETEQYVCHQTIYEWLKMVDF